MKYNDLTLGKDYSVKGLIYQLVSIKSFGIGPLFGCKKYVFKNKDFKNKALVAIQWQDGEIDRLKLLKV